MLVTMLKDKTGSENGVKINSYSKGVTYDLGDDLARSFLGEGSAVSGSIEPKVGGELVVESQEEQKALDASPENKMLDEPENKSRAKSKK